MTYNNHNIELTTMVGESAFPNPSANESREIAEPNKSGDFSFYFSRH